MFDFPSSPTNGQTFTSGGVSYAFDGTGWKMQGTAPGAYVLKTGDTMTGNLAITKTNPRLYLNKLVSGETVGLVGQTNGAARWSLQLGDANAETGANSTGSDFSLYRLTDDTTSWPCFGVNRALGNATFFSTVPSTSPTTGALTVAGGVGIGGELYSVGNHFITGSGGGLGGLFVRLTNTTPTTGKTWQFGTQDNDGSCKLTHTGVLDVIKMAHTTGVVSVLSSVASTSPTTGALTVAGGVGVAGDLNVAFTVTSRIIAGNYGIKLQPSSGTSTGWGAVVLTDGTLDIDELGVAQRFQIAPGGAVKIPGNIASTSSTTGALTVTGGVGVGLALNVASYASIAGAAQNQGGVTQNLAIAGDSSLAWCVGIKFTDASTGGAFISFVHSTNAAIGSIARTSSTSVAFNTASDVRGKPNREPLSPDAARNIIDALEVYDFDKDGNAIRGVGLVAQQAHTVHKSLATPGQKDEDWWMAEKAAPVPFMIANMQQLNQRLDEIERQLKEKP